MSSIVFASLSVRTREDSSRGTEGEAKVVVETEPATMHFEFAAPASGWQPVDLEETFPHKTCVMNVRDQTGYASITSARPSWQSVFVISTLLDKIIT